MPTLHPSLPAQESSEPLFASIANDLTQQGFSIQTSALPAQLCEQLIQHLATMDDKKFRDAGIGRGADYLHAGQIRSDEICWITGESEAGQQWLNWSQALQSYLNQHLFLGLFSFESHFAHYKPGDFYKRHYDAFKGQANRVLTLVAYFNHDWHPEDGGELVLYRNDQDKVGIPVAPELGTLVTFLSEDFPHEVLPTHRERYSIAGWYRLNSSIGNQIDPPS